MTPATEPQRENGRIKQLAAPDRARPESDARGSAKSARIKAGLEKIAAANKDDLGLGHYSPEDFAKLKRAIVQDLYASENEEEPQADTIPLAGFAPLAIDGANKKALAGKALRRGFYEVGGYALGLATITLLGYLILVGTNEIGWMDGYREYLQHLQSVVLWSLAASVIAFNVAMIISKNAYWIIYQIAWLLGNLVISGSVIGLLCFFWERGSGPSAQSIGSIIFTAFTVTVIGGLLWGNALVCFWINDNNYRPEYEGEEKTETVNAAVRWVPPPHDFLD
jgi:hypothetical protein